MSESETTTAPHADPEFQSEVWTYTGRGIDSDGALTHRWLDAAGKLRLFSKVGRTCIVGGRYELPVKHVDETNASVLASQMKYLGLADEDRVKTWHAQHVAARTEHERRQLEKKDGKSRLPTMTLSEMAEEYRRALPTRKAALLAEVIRLVTSRTAP